MSIGLGNFCLVYPSQRHNLSPALENITRKFPKNKIKISSHFQKFRIFQNFQKIPKFQLFFSKISKTRGILVWNMILPDYVICYIPQAMAILSWKWKFCNWLARRRRPLWCQWRPLWGFGNFGKKFWIWEFFSKILKILKFSKFWIKISKVGSKFWRWEGYITQKNFLLKQFLPIKF